MGVPFYVWLLSFTLFIQLLITFSHCCLLFHCMNMLQFIYSPTVDKHVDNFSFYLRILKTVSFSSGLH